MSGASQAASEAREATVFERTLAQAAAVTAFVAGTVGLLYVIGGAVLWLRFHEAGIPADRAVALVPKNDLLVLGLRVMVIPAVASGLFLLALGSWWRTRESRLEALLEQKAETQRQLAKVRGAGDGDEDEDEDDEESIKRRVHELDGKIKERTESGAPGDSLPRPGSNPIAFAILMCVAVAAALVVPFSFGAFAWPVVLAGLLLYWWHLRPVRPDPEGSRFPIGRLALAAVLGAATISIARQTDRPVELLSVRAEVVDAPKLVTGTLKPTNVRVEDGHRIADIGGVLVAIRSGELAIGDPDHRVIASVPRTYVRAMTIGPPLDQQAPPRSLLSRILGGRIVGYSAWAVTPLELWCDNIRYGWDRIDHGCHGAPSLRVARKLDIERDHIEGIAVDCPAASGGQCRGVVRVRAEERGANCDAPSTVLPVSIPPVPVALDEGVNAAIPITVDEDGLFELLEVRRRASHKRSKPRGRPYRIGVHVKLTLAEADAVVDEQDAKLQVDPPEPRVKTCRSQSKSGKRHGESRAKDPKGGGTQQTGTGAGSKSNGTSTTGSKSKPAPTASAEPSGTAVPQTDDAPSGADQLPPEDATLEAPTPEPTAAATR